MTAVPPESTPPVSPTVPVAPAKQGNPLGLASLIVGAVALLFGIIPILSFIAWLPALVAIGLAIGGFVVKNRSRVIPAIGLSLGILAIIVGIIVTVVSLATVAAGVKESVDQESTASAELVPIVYEVSGDAGTASVTYSTFDDGNSGTSQVADAPLPWSITSEVERGGAFDFNFYSLTASTGENGGTISCKITVDGEVLSENTASGAYAFATCSGNSTDLKNQ